MKARDEMIERFARQNTQEFVIGIEAAQAAAGAADVSVAEMLGDARSIASERIGADDTPGGRKMWAAHFGAEVGVYHELNRRNEAAA